MQINMQNDMKIYYMNGKTLSQVRAKTVQFPDEFYELIQNNFLS